VRISKGVKISLDIFQEVGSMSIMEEILDVEVR
jgi:hypothetical protein